ncbi:MAG: HEAT repeat domain-containing protein [Waterburya sp.]
MSAITNALERILEWLKQNQNDKELQSGLSIREIDEKIAELPLKLPKEVYELYQWRNGTAIDVEFFPGYWFFPLELAIDIYCKNMNIEKKLQESYEKNDDLELSTHVETWNQYWFPLFELSGQFYFINCSDVLQDTGTVWNFFPEFVYPELSYETLGAMMLTIAECYETGAYYLDDECCLEENETKVARIKRKYNSALARLSLNESKSEITLASLTQLSGNLIEFKNPEAVNPLIQILQSSTESINPEEQAGIKALVARILGEIGDSRAVLPLIKILCDEEYLTRYWTIISLGKLKDSRATLHLINLLQDSHQEVQKIAIWALGEIKDIGAIEPLTKLVSETIDPNIRQAAQDALLKIGRC